MNTFRLNQIGRVDPPDQSGFPIVLEPEYREALIGLEGFSRVNILWWAHNLDTDEYRKILSADKPYKMGPDKLGLFATRSPLRPNPVMITAVSVSRIDLEKGIIHTPYIDADPGTPVLDIKPYHGSTDRADFWEVPRWCSDWPSSIEASADFAWDEVFNF